MRNRQLTLAFIYVMTGLQLILSSTLPAKERPRPTISVVKHIGEDKEYDKFLTILRDRVKKLLEIYKAQDDFKYLRDLYVMSSKEPHDFEEFWRGTDSLLVLNSNIVPKNDKIIVTSNVYLCDLRGKLPENSVTLEQKMSISDFKLTRDSYTMLMFYVLAMDAKRMNRAPRVIAIFLNNADEISRDIHSGDRKGDIALLIEAIRKENQSYRPKGNNK